MDYLIWLLLGAAIVWLALTWWNTPDQHTFKAVLQDLFRDVRDICSPVVNRVWCVAKRVWAFVGPRLTNLPAMAVIALDIFATLTPEMREVMMQNHWIAGALLALNLVSRLSPLNAPAKIPAPMPDGGLVNTGALA